MAIIIKNAVKRKPGYDYIVDASGGISGTPGAILCFKKEKGSKSVNPEIVKDAKTVPVKPRTIYAIDEKGNVVGETLNLD